MEVHWGGGRWKLVDPWDSQASQPRRLSQFQASERVCPQRKGPVSHMLVHICIQTYVHIHMHTEQTREVLAHKDDSPVL